MKWPLLVISVLLLATIGWWIWWSYFDTYHFVVVEPGVLYRDGVRNMHQFDLAVRRSGVRTIVSLVDDSEISRQPFTDEAAYCQQHHIDLIRIPITLGGWPDGAQVQQFLAVVRDKSRLPVLVHCAQGVRRTGMMVAAFQENLHGYSPAAAAAAIQSFGHSERTTGDIRRFIAAYDPVRQQMTESLARSNE